MEKPVCENAYEVRDTTVRRECMKGGNFSHTMEWKPIASKRDGVCPRPRGHVYVVLCRLYLIHENHLVKHSIRIHHSRFVNAPRHSPPPPLAAASLPPPPIVAAEAFLDSLAPPSLPPPTPPSHAQSSAASASLGAAESIPFASIADRCFSPMLHLTDFIVLGKPPSLSPGRCSRSCSCLERELVGVPAVSLPEGDV